MTPLRLNIEGIGAWARGVPDWPALRAILRGECDLREDAPSKPAAAVLPPAERRRAPEAVLLAAEVSAQACAMSRRDPASLPCVFASTHGELAITDYLCATLGAAPRELSPTRFHNSVHNAPAGYWTIATHCERASSAVTGWHASFGAGLLEAALLAAAEPAPVLFAAYDTASTGPLAEMTRTMLPFGTAFVLSPSQVPNPGPAMVMRIRAGETPLPMPDVAMALQPLAADNPLDAHALALLAALAGDAPARMTLPAAPGLLLDLEIHP
ncbi:MAG: beta-ketoacyl synthase chain length factor [Proteobacteria bacterium]|nr:beta-ketoacyl synthase chain length factor [Pseudomonadota bacterium]